MAYSFVSMTSCHLRLLVSCGFFSRVASSQLWLLLSCGFMSAVASVASFHCPRRGRFVIAPDSKILSALNNLTRPKFSAKLVFSQNIKVERWIDVKFLNRFPFFFPGTTHVHILLVTSLIFNTPVSRCDVYLFYWNGAWESRSRR